MKRKLLLLLIAVALMLCVCACGSAVPPETSGRFRLQDDAKLFTEEGRERIRNSVEKLCKYGHVGVVTRDGKYELFGETTAKFAQKIYGQWFGTESGVLFVIDMKNRMIYIETDGYIGSSITRGKARTITDNTYGLATAGNYAACTVASLMQVLDVIEGRKISNRLSRITNAFIAVFIGLIANAFVLVKILQKPVVNVENAEYAVSGDTVFSDYSIKEKDKKVIRVYHTDSYGSRGFFGGGDFDGGDFGGGSGGSHGSHGGGHGF